MFSRKFGQQVCAYDSAWYARMFGQSSLLKGWSRYAESLVNYAQSLVKFRLLYAQDLEAEAR